jgi:signal transduction histidine kinase
MRPRNLRHRVALAMAALVVLVVSTYSSVLYALVDRQEEDLIDRILSEEIAHFIARQRAEPGASPPEMEKLVGYFARDAAARARLPKAVRELRPGLHEIFVEGQEQHVAIRDEPEGRFVMVYDVEHHEVRAQRFMLLSLLVAGLTAVVAAALGYWMAGYLTDPVSDFARKVEALRPGSKATLPAPAPDEDEEIRRLGRAFDAYVRTVSDLVQRERDFAANLSHELRTPLTAIRTGCELLLLREATLSSSGRSRVEAIDRSAARLVDTIRSLFYLAREAKEPELEDVSVQECVAEAADPMRSTLEERGIELQTEIDPAARVRVERTALFLVADNLLRNAAAYTERGRIHVLYRDGSLVVEDTGPGIDPALLPRLGERFYRGERGGTGEGMGLGLAIIRRICERFGWSLELSGGANGGTRAVVRFPVPSSREIHAPSTVS